MQNIKKISRKIHIILGCIFAFPLIFSCFTAVLFVIFKEIFHNRRLAHFAMDLHTLRIIGLEDIYPFIFLFGMIGLVITGFILLKKNK